MKSFSFLGLSFLAVVIGAVAGLGAVVFRGLIALFHNLLFLGQLSWTYDANAHTPASPWGVGIVLVPVAGAVAVAFLVQRFAPEAKGHGVPEVMDAIYYNRGEIRPSVAVIKSLASALSIGSGGAVGREGPIIQIGAALGSTMGQLLRMPPWQRITLVAAGAAGGIAATFNTPVGGVLFAVEMVMLEVGVKTLVPVALATATATYVGRIFFGVHPSFVIPGFETPYFHLATPYLLLAYVGLGLLVGALSAVYIRAVYAFEDLFEKRVPGNYTTRHMLGMLLVGILMYMLLATRGHYYIQGVGYATVQDILTGALSSVPFLLLLCGLKLLATCLTLGSGASGGIFSPGLFMGATLGAAYGALLQAGFPGLAIQPPAFAVAGMAGVIGGSTGAALAAIVMIFEMTLDYNVIIPMTLTVALAYGIRRTLVRDSIYTLKLARRGHRIPDGMQASFHQMNRAADLMDESFEVVAAPQTLAETRRLLSERTDVSWFLVTDADRPPGVMTREAILRELGLQKSEATLGELAERNYALVEEDAAQVEILRRMRRHATGVAVVVRRRSGVLSPQQVRGLITKSQIADTLGHASELLGDE
jgi:CIC family chloride channel protein